MTDLAVYQRSLSCAGSSGADGAEPREARPPVLSRLNLVLTVVLALLAGLVWFQADRTEQSIADFQGWIFFSTNYWMLFSLFGALFNCEFSTLRV